MDVTYPLGGWLAPGKPFSWQHEDHGQDLAIGGDHIIQAPGDGIVVAVLSDASFPNGFGPAYPIVEIHSGEWKDHQWYLGHTTSLLTPGTSFHFGRPLTVANQSEKVSGWPAGWVELGQAYNGGPGYDNPPHWYRPLFAPLTMKVPDPVLHGPSKPGGTDFTRGKDVWLLTWRLHYIDSHAYVGLGYSSNVVNWVKAFQIRHKLHRRDGNCDSETWLAIKYSAEACKRRHQKEL